MKIPAFSRALGFYALLSAIAGTTFSTSARAQMVANADMEGFGSAFSLPQIDDNQAQRGDDASNLLKAQRNANLSTIQTASSIGTNILWPSESSTFTFRFSNLGNVPRHIDGHIEVISFSTRIETGGVWLPLVKRQRLESRVPVTIDFAKNGIAQLTVKPNIPARFGGYALVFDFGRFGRVWGAGVARVVHATEGRVFAPGYALDMARSFQMTPRLPASFRKMGVKAARFEVGYTPTYAPDYQERMAQLDAHLRWAKANDISVMLTLGAGSAPQMLGRGRPWLDEKGVMRQGMQEDLAWAPAYDEDFQKWTRNLAAKYGYPRGAVNAMELWNEPWEGVSISGWGADGERYRKIYRHMARGILQARQTSGTRVLIGGASSSSNTLDKLFADGTDKFLPILDFASLHYQAMGVTPALIPAWRNRKNPMGRVRVWDTESWVANSEDRIVAVVASMRAMGHDRVMGTFGGNVYTLQNYGSDAATSSVVQAWPPAAAASAVAKFIGERPFHGLLQKGLPWIFAFDGAAPRGADDGTVVVVGDLSGVYDRDMLMYRGVLGLGNAPRVAALQARLDALPASADTATRTRLQDALKRAAVLENGTLTLSNRGGKFRLLDFYGNIVPASGGKIVVPLNGRGYFLRTDGSRNSFAALLNELKKARAQGYQPLEIVAHDFTAPLSQKPMLRLTLTNILNRPVRGTLQVSLRGLKLDASTRTLAFAANETKTLEIHASGSARDDNRYSLQAVFNGGTDGSARLRETMSAKVIAHKTIVVDGKLGADEWRGVLPQTLSAPGIARSQTEAAWLPFQGFNASTRNGQTTAYLAYDAKYFYFAAKTADSTPDSGTLRFAERDDSRFFYPPVAYQQAATARTFSVRWTGFLQAPHDGNYVFTTLSDDGARLWIDGQKLIDNWTPHSPTENSAGIALKAGQKVTIRLEYFQGGGADIHLSWQSNDMARQIVPATALFSTQNDATTGSGLNGEYFRDIALTDFVVRRTDAQIDFTWVADALPDAAFARQGENLQALPWQKDVRRYTYRREPELPSGNDPAHDNIQIAFNAIPLEQKKWLSHSPGTPPRWQVYPDTDYEYALNTVAGSRTGPTKSNGVGGNKSLASTRKIWPQNFHAAFEVIMQ